MNLANKIIQQFKIFIKLLSNNNKIMKLKIIIKKWNRIIRIMASNKDLEYNSILFMIINIFPEISILYNKIIIFFNEDYCI